MDIWTQVFEDRIETDNVLRKINALIDWKRVGWKVGKVRSKLGRAGYDVDLMLKVTLLSQWYSLSDRDLERALKVRLDFMLFCGSGVMDNSPDHSTICRFRNALVKLDLFDAVLDEVNRQLQAHDLMVRDADVAIVDATLVETAACPSKEIEVMPEDRKENEIEPNLSITERLSHDADAKWIKKGRKSTLGYKVFARTDGEGFVDKIMARPANEGEQPHLPAMARGAKAKRLLSDKGLTSAANREALKEMGIKNGLMFKAVRGRSLTEWQKQFNRIVSKSRWIIEQSFGTMKRKFNASRARYMTRIKVEAEMTWKAISLSLLKAANMVKLT